MRSRRVRKKLRRVKTGIFSLCFVFRSSVMPQRALNQGVDVGVFRRCGPFKNPCSAFKPTVVLIRVVLRADVGSFKGPFPKAPWGFYSMFSPRQYGSFVGRCLSLL